MSEVRYGKYILTHPKFSMTMLRVGSRNSRLQNIVYVAITEIYRTKSEVRLILTE